MECNKDEACRAKEIAERKITERDYAGAKKFALKAQNLYQGLDGLSQMLTAIDVYVSAENKVGGEADWYGVLGINPWADDETVRKQYRKLALMLHPDKNKSVGADGAFKLVSEAWSLLSDKTKRLAYNQRVNPRGNQQKFPSQSGASSVPPRANGSYSSGSTISSKTRTQTSNFQTGPTSVASKKKPATFWTVCNGCRTQYEYLRVYLNHTLLCPNCHEAFLALEKAPPPNVYRSSNWFSGQPQHNSTNHAGSNNQFNYEKNSVAQSSRRGRVAGLDSSTNTNFQWHPFPPVAGVNSNVASSSTASGATSVVQQAQEKVKRNREEAPVDLGTGNAYGKMSGSSVKVERLVKRRKDDIRVNGYVGSMSTQMAMGNGPGMGNASESKRKIPETENTFGYFSNYNKPNSHRELSTFEIRNMLVDRSRIEIRKKLKEWSTVSEAKNSSNEKDKAREKGSKRQKSVLNGDAYELKKQGESCFTNKQYHGKEFSHSLDDSDMGTQGTLTINVPDPDFHNFDLDRTESAFGDDQVWAAYDDDDGMPRFYARIHKVISLKPFKMKISWLNSRSNSELGPLDWVGSGFSKTCGEFRTGRHEICDTLNAFSHKVQWTKGTRGVVQIYPRKGDVWAVYRNWSADWNEHTPDEVIHKYDMVEVLDDYNEEKGVSVSPLIKVAGFRTVFHKHMDPKEIRKIPKEEMFRFSHQVPNYLLTGQEADNAPSGCRELDPAATPLELLQVINEASEASLADNSRKSENEISQKALKTGQDERVTSSSNGSEEEVEENS